MPDARFNPDGTLRFGMAYARPYFDLSANATLLPWLETNLAVRRIDGVARYCRLNRTIFGRATELQGQERRPENPACRRGQLVAVGRGRVSGSLRDEPLPEAVRRRDQDPGRCAAYARLRQPADQGGVRGRAVLAGMARVLVAGRRIRRERLREFSVRGAIGRERSNARDFRRDRGSTRVDDRGHFEPARCRGSQRLSRDTARSPGVDPEERRTRALCQGDPPADARAVGRGLELRKAHVPGALPAGFQGRSRPPPAGRAPRAYAHQPTHLADEPRGGAGGANRAAARAARNHGDTRYLHDDERPAGGDLHVFRSAQAQPLLQRHVEAERARRIGHHPLRGPGFIYA